MEHGASHDITILINFEMGKFQTRTQDNFYTYKNTIDYRMWWKRWKFLQLDFCNSMNANEKMKNDKI